jgi:hypothetical protein
MYLQLAVSCFANLKWSLMTSTSSVKLQQTTRRNVRVCSVWVYHLAAPSGRYCRSRLKIPSARENGWKVWSGSVTAAIVWLKLSSKFGLYSSIFEMVMPKDGWRSALVAYCQLYILAWRGEAFIYSECVSDLRSCSRMYTSCVKFRRTVRLP